MGQMGRVIIIGAGMAGLAAGCYARMNGYDARIFEMHRIPGGVCTAWKREGFTIDGCIHWVTGIKPGSDFYPVWQELGIAQGWTMVEPALYARIEGPGGEALDVPCDVDQLEATMLALAPEDAAPIRRFTQGIRDLIGFPIPWQTPAELMGIREVLSVMRSMLPFLGPLRRFGKLTLGEYADRFRNPFLREAFLHIFNLENPPDFPLLAVMLTFGWMHQRVCGYPIGGSLKFALSVARRFEALGGEIQYRARVERVLVEDDRAVGVRLDDGTEHRADHVISAADGRTTIFHMLEGNYVDDTIRGYYARDELRLFEPLIYVGLGLRGMVRGVPHTVTGVNVPLQTPTRIADRERSRLSVQFYDFDPTLAPEGAVTARVHLPTRFEYWDRLRRDPAGYDAEKAAIADTVVALLDRRFPGLADTVAMRDVATPMAWVHYTGNWRGSFEGWRETTRTLRLRMKQTLPGLEGFCMAGQWVQPGGSLPAVAVSGRSAVQLLCHADGKAFVAG